MTELGQLETHHGEFDARNTRLVAVSLDDLAETARTKEQFPHLTVVSDAGQSLAKAAAVLGPHQAPTGGETISPTTVLLDRSGTVRWVFRPERYTTRLSPAELLAAVDAHLGRAP
jgi:peroxiredoxin